MPGRAAPPDERKIVEQRGESAIGSRGQACACPSLADGTFAQKLSFAGEPVHLRAQRHARSVLRQRAFDPFLERQHDGVAVAVRSRALESGVDARVFRSAASTRSVTAGTLDVQPLDPEGSQPRLGQHLHARRRQRPASLRSRCQERPGGVPIERDLIRPAPEGRRSARTGRQREAGEQRERGPRAPREATLDHETSLPRAERA